MISQLKVNNLKELYLNNNEIDPLTIMESFENEITNFSAIMESYEIINEKIDFSAIKEKVMGFIRKAKKRKEKNA